MEVGWDKRRCLHTVGGVLLLLLRLLLWLHNTRESLWVVAQTDATVADNKQLGVFESIGDDSNISGEVLHSVELGHVLQRHRVRVVHQTAQIHVLDQILNTEVEFNLVQQRGIEHSWVGGWSWCAVRGILWHKGGPAIVTIGCWASKS